MLGVSGVKAETTITVNTASPLTDVSQISTEKYYVLYNVGRTKYVNVNTTSGQVALSASLPTESDAELLPYIVRFVPNTNAKDDGSALQVKFYDGTYIPWATPVVASATMGNDGYVPSYVDDHFIFTAWRNKEQKTSYFNGNENSFVFYSVSTDETSKYQIYEATCENFQEVAYNFSYEGKTTTNNTRKLLTVKNTLVARPTNKGYYNPTYADVSYSITAPSDGSDITFPISYPFYTTTLEGDEFPANTPLYRLKGNVGNTPKYIKRSSDAVIYKDDDDITDDDYFCFSGNPFDGFKIYNIGAGTSVNVGSDTPTQGTSPALTDKEHIWHVFANSTGYGLQQMKTDGTSLSNAYLCNVNQDKIPFFTYWISSWAATDGGARMAIEPVTFDVTYNVLLEANGSTVASGTETKATGGDLALNVNSTTAGRSFCTYTYYSDVACTEEITSAVFGGTNNVYALANVNLPFDPDKYYYMKLRGHYVFYNEATDEVRANQSSKETTDAYRWSLSGDPYNGIKVKNKQTGTYFDNTSGNVQLTAEGYAWRIVSLNGTSTFGLNNGSNYINEQNHTNHLLIYWWQFADDTGSQFNIEEVEPQSGSFYRIKGVKSGKYMTGNTYNKGGYNRLGQSSEADASTIFYLDGDKLLSYITGFYVTATCEPGSLSSTPSTYVFTPDGTTVGEWKIAGNGAYLYSWNNTYECFDRNGTTYAEQCHMTIEEVTTLPVSISSVGYATLYAPVALTIPGGVTAYIASDEGDYLQLTAIDGGIIPANTGVILEGDEGTHNFAITTGGSAAGNELTGTVATITKPATAYYLSNGDKGLGFYKGGSATNMAGFKAYYDPGASVKGFLPFVFGDATGIKSIENGQSATEGIEIYNIAGQRVSKLQRGVNIVNGKKVLVK